MRMPWLRMMALALALPLPALVPATASARSGDSVRIYAGSTPLRDAAGRQWRPAGSALDGRRSRIRRPLDITHTPKLYETLAEGLHHARLRVGRPGRYAVTLYLAESRRLSRPRTFRVTAPGVSQVVDVPVGGGLQRPVHTAFEVVVRGRSLTLRFRAAGGRPEIAAVEAERLGPVGMAPVAPVFEDRFDGPAGSAPAAATWEAETGFGWGPTQVQAYTDRPENVALDGAGRLAITARAEDYVDARGVQGSYTSGRIESRLPITLERTRIEARVRVPPGAGLWPVFWASGVEPPAWPASGELDIMEFSGLRPRLLYGFVHGPQRRGSPQAYQNGATAQRLDFAAATHLYGIRTEPGVVEFTVDGHRYGSVSRADVPRGAPWLLARPYRLVFSLALGGFGGVIAPGTAFPARMLVDDVSVWR